MKNYVLQFLIISMISSFVIISCEEEKNETGENTDTTDSTITDIDGNIYNKIIIGNQTWMVENLKVTHYTDGTEIKLESNNNSWGVTTEGAYCWYNNDGELYSNDYGALYNWIAVVTGKICPEGWHVPSDAEWLELENFIINDGYEGTVGYVLKANYKWIDNGYGTDVYGFKAFPGGNRPANGDYKYLGNSGFWWSSSLDNDKVWIRSLDYNNSNLHRVSALKTFGMSIRCIKD